MPLPHRLALLAIATAFALAVGVQLGWLLWPLDRAFGFVPGDDWDVQLTLVEVAGRNWSLGHLPAWNPYTAGGVPLLANPETPAFYPTSLLAAWLPLGVAVRLSVASFGHNLPVNLFAALHAFPPLDRFRHPERFALVWVPLLCVLAGIGFDALTRRPAARVALVTGSRPGKAAPTSG